MSMFWIGILVAVGIGVVYALIRVWIDHRMEQFQADVNIVENWLSQYGDTWLVKIFRAITIGDWDGAIRHARRIAEAVDSKQEFLALMKPVVISLLTDLYHDPDVYNKIVELQTLYPEDE